MIKRTIIVDGTEVNFTGPDEASLGAFLDIYYAKLTPAQRKLVLPLANEAYQEHS